MVNIATIAEKTFSSGACQWLMPKTKVAAWSSASQGDQMTSFPCTFPLSPRRTFATFRCVSRGLNDNCCPSPLLCSALFGGSCLSKQKGAGRPAASPLNGVLGLCPCQRRVLFLEAAPVVHRDQNLHLFIGAWGNRGTGMGSRSCLMELQQSALPNGLIFFSFCRSPK